MVVPPPPPPASLSAWAKFGFKCVEKYAHATRALAPLALTFSSSKIVFVLQAFHPLVSPSPYPNSLMAF
jgi:hypothetical protein